MVAGLAACEYEARRWRFAVPRGRRPVVTSSVRVGVVYPQFELHGDPDAVRSIGVAVEHLGFDYLLAYDHVLVAPHDREPRLTGPYTEVDSFHDPFMLFSHLAGMTSRIGFVTGVLILPQRQTALVARQAADLQLLSSGRLRLGVGTGWNHVEYDALGQDFATRGARLSEQVDLVRRLWTEPLVTFQGRFDHVDRAGVLPRPHHPIPIWMGGATDAAYRRALQVGDGFIFSGTRGAPTDELARVRVLAEKVGRNIDDGFGLEAMAHQMTPAQVAAAGSTWRSSGGTHFSVATMRQGLDSIDAHLDYIHRVAELLDDIRAPRPAGG